MVNFSNIDRPNNYFGIGKREVPNGKTDADGNPLTNLASLVKVMEDRA